MISSQFLLPRLSQTMAVYLKKKPSEVNIVIRNRKTRKNPDSNAFLTSYIHNVSIFTLMKYSKSNNLNVYYHNDSFKYFLIQEESLLHSQYVTIKTYLSKLSDYVS